MAEEASDPHCENSSRNAALSAGDLRAPSLCRVFDAAVQLETGGKALKERWKGVWRLTDPVDGFGVCANEPRRAEIDESWGEEGNSPGTNQPCSTAETYGQT